MTKILYQKLGLALGAIALVGPGGCGLSKRIAHNSIVPFIYDPIAIEERIDQDGNEVVPFNLLNHGLEENIKAVYIIPRTLFFSRSTRAHSHTTKGTIGLLRKGTICLSRNYNPGDVYHEAAHIRHAALDEAGSKFSREWEELANFEYDRWTETDRSWDGEINIVSWRGGGFGSKQGCLTPYGGTHLREDIATFVEALGYDKTPQEMWAYLNSIEPAKETDSKEFKDFNKALINLNKIIGMIIGEREYPLYFCDPSDLRYEQKLDLLEKYGFLTDEEYDKLRNRLGSLSHLLRIEDREEKRGVDTKFLKK